MGLEHEPEAEVVRDAHRLVVCKGGERAERRDRRAPSSDLAAPRRPEREPNGGLEGRWIGRVELEDAGIGRDRLAGGEPPRLETRELPERAEPGADVGEALALLLEDVGDLLRARPAPRDRLEEAERTDVPWVAVVDRVEERACA